MSKTVNIINNIREELTKSFCNLQFDEASHTYLYNGKKFKSTTSIIEQFKDHFDSYKAAERKAKKILENNPNDRRNEYYYRNRWELIRTEASSRGSRVHLYAECYPHFDEPYCDKERGVLEFFQSYLPKHLHVVMLEFRMYDETMNLAGTTDGILYNEETGKLVLFDFKTNSKNLFKYDRKLRSTMSKELDSSYNIYSLQLSHYKYMLEKKTNYKVEKGILVWLSNDTFNDKYVQRVKSEFKGKYCKIYKVKDFTKELINHLDPSKPINGMYHE